MRGLSAGSQTFTVNSVGVGAGSQGEVSDATKTTALCKSVGERLGAPVLKRTQLLPPLVQREVAFSQENDGGIVIVDLRLGFLFYVHFFGIPQRNEPKKAHERSSSRLPPTTTLKMRGGANYAIRSITSFGRSDPKDCVGNATRGGSFSDTVKRGAPTLNCVF